VVANRERGEFRLVARDRDYVLRLTVEACCHLEDLADRTLSTVINGANEGSATDIRLLMWAALQPFHRKAAQTVTAVGSLIDRLGGVPAAHEAIGRLIALNLDDAPDDDDKQSESDTDKPPENRWRRLYIDARKAGIQPETFWSFSLRELWRELAAQREQREAEWTRDRVQAWTTAAFATAAFAGKLPPFHKVTGRKQPKQTPEQMKAVVKMLQQIYPNSKHVKKKDLKDGPRRRRT
jgi:hypothetical protein